MAQHNKRAEVAIRAESELSRLIVAIDGKENSQVGMNKSDNITCNIELKFNVGSDVGCQKSL